MRRSGGRARLRLPQAEAGPQDRSVFVEMALNTGLWDGRQDGRRHQVPGTGDHEQRNGLIGPGIDGLGRVQEVRRAPRC